MATNIGPKIGIDGEAEYRRELNNIIQQAKTLDSEMKAVTSTFNKNTTAEERNAATSKVLAQQISVQEKRVSELKKGLDDATNAFGETDDRTLKWKTALNEATADLNKMKQKMDEGTDAVDDLGNEMDNAEKKTFSFGDALKANLLSQAIIAGVKKLASAVKDFASEIIETAASVKAENAQFEQTFSSIGDEAESAFSRVSKSAGIMESRLKPVGTSLYAFAKTTGMDSTQALNLMERALNATADSAAYYDRSLEDVSESLTSFLKGNYANDAALGLSATETTRNAKANELYGKSFKDLSEAQKQLTLLAMVEDANKLSGALGQAARESDGWENVLGNLNETWRQFQARVGAPFLEALIPIVQKITVAFQDWMESVDWDAFSKSITDFIDGIIENGSTILTLVAGIGAGFVTWNVSNLIKSAVTAIMTLGPALTGATAAQNGLNAAVAANPIGAVITIIATLVSAIITLWNTNEDFRNGVTAVWEAISDVFSAVWGAIVDFFTKTIPDAWNAVVGFFKGIPEWWSNLWLQVGNFFKNIWNSIISFFTETIPAWIQSIIQWFQELPRNIGYAIGQIIGFFIQMGQNVWNWITVELPKIFDGIIKWFAALPETIWNWLVEVVTNIAQWGMDIWDTAIEAVTSFFNGVIQFFAELPGTIWNWLVEVVTNIAKWGNEMWNKAISAVSNTVSGIINWFKELPGNLLQIGKDMIKGLWDGICGMGQWIWDQITGFFGGIVDGIKGFLGIHSPSKVFAEIGEYSGEGFGQGLSASMDQALNAAGKQIETGLNSFDTAASIAYPTVGTTLGGTPASSGVNYGGFNINVYAAEGMDENTLAEVIMQKIQATVARKGAVFG